MGQIVKVKCNGPNKHVNEVDLDALLKTTVMVRGPSASDILPDDLPNELVKRCRECISDVVITREMLREMLK